MKKDLVIAIAIFLSTITVFAQKQTETFETNSWGWTETSSKEGEAIIKEGVFHFEGKKAGGVGIMGVVKRPSFIETHCYAGYDPSRNFEIKCTAIVKKITDDGNFGLMLDYLDDGNFVLFTVKDDEAWLIRYKNGEEVGRIRNLLKQKGKKHVSLDISVKSTYQKLQFSINGMMVVEARYLPMITDGIGFYVMGDQTIDFDNVEITQ